MDKFAIGLSRGLIDLHSHLQVGSVKCLAKLSEDNAKFLFS